MNYFNYNGKIFKEGSPIIGADNRGLRYGDGLFETMKIKNGQLVFEDEHFARLWKGLRVLQFEIPKHFTVDSLRLEIITLAKKNGHEVAARIRLNIIRGDGGLYDAKNHGPHYIIQTWKLPDENGQWNGNGLVLGIYEEVKKGCDILSNIKHNNYLPYVMAALHAKSEKWNDAIVLNSNGRICDTTIANVFMVKDRTIYTPSLNEGCVAGVMRKIFIKKMTELGWQLVEKELPVDDLLNADEVFLTNSIYNLRWVQSIGDSVYQSTIFKQIYTEVIQTIS